MQKPKENEEVLVLVMPVELPIVPLMLMSRRSFWIVATTAAIWTKFGGDTNLDMPIANLKSADRCGELEGRHRRRQVRLEGDDGGELDQTRWRY